LILFKLNLIPYPSIPNLSSLGNFFIVKFMIENRNFFENCAFCNIAYFSIFGLILQIGLGCVTEIFFDVNY
jgi:hypothetical protein